MSDPFNPTPNPVRPDQPGTRPEPAARETPAMLDAARERAESLAEEGVAAGAERAGGFARAVHRAAEAIAPESPTLARAMHDAAGGLDGMARRLRDRGPGEMLRGAEDLARRQPLMVFGAAALAGFALARFARSSGTRRTTTAARAPMPRHDTPMATTATARQAAHHAGDVPPTGGPGWVREAGEMPRPATLSAATLGGAAAAPRTPGET